MASFVLSAPAASDLREIHAFIAADDPAAARRVLNDLREAMHRLADLPGRGHVRNDLVDETLRIWTVHPYLVIYRPESTLGRCRSFVCSVATATSRRSSSSSAPLPSRYGRGASQ